MASLAELTVELSLQSAAFQRGMDQANAQMAKMEANSRKASTGIQSIASSLKGAIAGAGLAAIAGMAKSLIDAADAAADTAAAFGTTIDRIYAFQQASLEAGGKVDGLQNGLQKLADTVDNAFEGSDTAVQAFARLGISMDSIKNQKLDQIFERVTAALAKETDEVKRNALAKELLGKSMIGVDYDVFNKGAARASEEYAHLNPYLQQAADFSDALAAKWKSFTTYLTAGVGAAVKIASDLAGAFGKIYDVVSGKKSLLEAITFTEVEQTAAKAAPQIERVAQATASQTKAAAEAAKATEAWNKEIAKQVESQIAWERKLLDTINPMNEVDRELAKLQVAMDAGRLTQEQFAEGFFKITDAATTSLPKIKDPLDEIGVAVGNLIAQGVNGLIDSFFQAGQSFAQFTQNFLTNIAKMITQLLVMQAIKKSLGGTSVGAALGFADGGAFKNGTGLPHGIYTQPTFFPMGGTGLMKFANGGVFGGGAGVLGESGPEAIMPLKRSGSGSLGVQATPAPTTINVINNNNSQVQIQENESEKGKQIDIIISQKVKEMFNTGAMDKTMSSNYGARRVGY